MQERIDNHEARLKRLEQRTEEMKAINVNVGSKDVLDQLQAIEQGQKDLKKDVEELKLDSKAYTGDAAIFKNKVEGIESDVSTLKSDVSMLKTDMEQVKTDIGTLKTDMEQVKTIQSGHSKFFEEHGKRLAATATKEDLATLVTKDELRSELSAMETRIIESVKQLLQQKPGE